MPRGRSDKTWDLRCRICGTTFERRAQGRPPTYCDHPDCERAVRREWSARYYATRTGYQQRWRERRRYEHRIDVLTAAVGDALMRVGVHEDADVRMVVEALDELLPAFRRVESKGEGDGREKR